MTSAVSHGACLAARPVHPAGKSETTPLRSTDLEARGEARSHEGFWGLGDPLRVCRCLRTEGLPSIWGEEELARALSSSSDATTESVWGPQGEGLTVSHLLGFCGSLMGVLPEQALFYTPTLPGALVTWPTSRQEQDGTT